MKNILVLGFLFGGWVIAIAEPLVAGIERLHEMDAAHGRFLDMQRMLDKMTAMNKVLLEERKKGCGTEL